MHPPIRLVLQKSTDLGKSWENIDRPDLTATSMVVDADNGVIYVAGFSSKGYQAVYKSTTNRSTWDLIGTNEEL